MKIVCISDTHLMHAGGLCADVDTGFPYIPYGDVLIHAGDALNHGSRDELKKFARWFGGLPHKIKIYVPGNHDRCFETKETEALGILHSLARDVIYLRDSGCMAGPYSVWGAPWQPNFYDWAFQLERGSEQMKRKWELIPTGVDILITHGPPLGILDQVGSVSKSGERTGCNDLRDALVRVRPRLHVFGHIHYSHGTRVQDGTTFVNAAICDEDYNPTNQPVVVDLDEPPL